MCDSCYVSEHRIPAAPDSVLGLEQGCSGWHISSFSSDLPGIFLKELQSVEEGLCSSFPHHHSELSFCPTPSFGGILSSHINIQNYSSVPRRHSELLFSPTSLLRTIILPPHVINQNYHSVPRHHSELFFHPTSSFGNYSSARHHHSGAILPSDVTIRELFFRPTSPFGNYSSVRR